MDKSPEHLAFEQASGIKTDVYIPKTFKENSLMRRIEKWLLGKPLPINAKQMVEQLGEVYTRENRAKAYNAVWALRRTKTIKLSNNDIIFPQSHIADVKHRNTASNPETIVSVTKQPDALTAFNTAYNALSTLDPQERTKILQALTLIL